MRVLYRCEEVQETFIHGGPAQRVDFLPMPNTLRPWRTTAREDRIAIFVMDQTQFGSFVVGKTYYVDVCPSGDHAPS